MAEHLALDWRPEQTWVFVVGILEWKHADMFSPFPQEQRRDAALVEFFRGQGLPEERIVYLQDRQATTRHILVSLEAHLKSAGPDDLLLLYYCGHGSADDDGAIFFASYDAGGAGGSGWAVDSIPVTINRHFRGARALLLADCCYSGHLADAIAGHSGKVGYACLASSLASEGSTANWTFTEALLAGLRGEAFVDSDGSATITLAELAEHIQCEMAFAEEQLASFATAGPFDPHMLIARARQRNDARIGSRVAVRSAGGWYPAQIIGVRDDELLIHYYGYNASEDEWVTSAQVRTVTRPLYPVGATVEVEWKQRWFAATVVAVRTGIHCVQYEGYGPEWNEWVSSRRIRPLL